MTTELAYQGLPPEGLIQEGPRSREIAEMIQGRSLIVIIQRPEAGG